ncbi:MAG: hypothetical protein GDA55_00495 [Cellvibrionales bacterium]|nr:hypothetical protein [Cellvibrionales bacterium]
MNTDPESGHLSDQAVAVAIDALSSELNRRDISLESYEKNKRKALAFLYAFGKRLCIADFIAPFIPILTAAIYGLFGGCGTELTNILHHLSDYTPITVLVTGAFAVLGGTVISIALLSRHSWGNKEDSQGTALLATLNELRSEQSNGQ